MLAIEVGVNKAHIFMNTIFFSLSDKLFNF